jgi:ADP-ribose pyrophosphatase
LLCSASITVTFTVKSRLAEINTKSSSGMRSSAGTRDGNEPYEECAAREIREETGMEAATLKHIGSFYLAPGYSTEYMGVFLALDLQYNPLEADDDEFLSVEKVPVREAILSAERGEIPDAKSLAALLMARPHLEKYL